ncbi:glycosyltransferase family 4 protein [Echinicola jeungdonensis]|uniref:Glycosyltransferase family 4 protein n=1 Tax=Echinicola jeungdonensis TaxID=709343 RepID=A0ABV5J085_9BACT|nr:glycosyltransferase family 4 protein [Echinicola jeungdonensis]MDN3671155.1 glycosyltransferase family 4 protein [Echinicola jeungdonensis]
MEILYVSRSKTGRPHPFIIEQADVLCKDYGHSIHHYLIKKGGLWGYLLASYQIYIHTKKVKTDIIHVHYGLSAIAVIISKLLSLGKIKVVITFHGSDINKSSERIFSLFAAQYSAHNILVSNKMSRYFRKNYSIIPCGIDTKIGLNFREMTRALKGWGNDDFIILFSSSFNRREKDPEFAFEVVNTFAQETQKQVKFLELKGYHREEITQLMQAADVMIMCSQIEGSPQVVKESILNSLPVISNDVGDVKFICSEVDNCFIIPKNVESYVQVLHYLSEKKLRVQNRSPILEKFDNQQIAKKINKIYDLVARI